MALTDAWLKANDGKPREKVFEKADRDGLSIRATTKGKLVYQLRYRYHGKPVRLDLGSYPGMTLKAAREEAIRLRSELEQGKDPKVVRALEKQTIRTALTFRELFMEWYRKYCANEKKAHAEILRTFELHVFDRLGNLPAADITLHMWLPLLEELTLTVPAIADRILMNTKECYWWGVRRELVPQNPLQNLNGKSDLQIPRNVQVRSLSDRELLYIWRALGASRLDGKNKLLMRLALAYGCRWSELRLAKKEHLDYDKRVWEVPKENHKNGRITGKPLLRPLLPHTEALFKEACLYEPDHEFVFVSSRTGKTLIPTAQTSWTYRIQHWVETNCGYKMEHWTLHDFRATVRTRLSMFTEPHIAEKMIGHKLTGVWELYDRYDYLPEQAVAYQKWWDMLQEIVSTPLSQLSAHAPVAPMPEHPR